MVICLEKPLHLSAIYLSKSKSLSLIYSRLALFFYKARWESGMLARIMEFGGLVVIDNIIGYRAIKNIRDLMDRFWIWFELS